ncbi:hypothetical protein NKH77_02480 [Streptomyces sp. M19]
MGDVRQSGTGPTSDPADREEIAEALEQLAFLSVRHLTNRDISFTAASTLGRLRRGGPARLTALAADEGSASPR